MDSATQDVEAEGKRRSRAEPAFWLGYLDGDGCVVISPDGVPRIHFVGTRALMGQCAAFLAAGILDRRPSVHRHSAEGIL